MREGDTESNEEGGGTKEMKEMVPGGNQVKNNPLLKIFTFAMLYVW